MTLKRYTSHLFLVTLAFVLGVLSVFFYPFKLSKPNVTIDVRDMRYACGDCYISFGISGVPNDDDSSNNYRSSSPNRFIGWDILVEFKGNDSYLEAYQAKRFAKDPNCGWPVFRMTGQFKRRLINVFIYNGDEYDGIYFDALSGVVINKNPECSDFPEETVLD